MDTEAWSRNQSKSNKMFQIFSTKFECK